jgi:hypothetical protein
MSAKTKIRRAATSTTGKAAKFLYSLGRDIYGSTDPYSGLHTSKNKARKMIQSGEKINYNRFRNENFNLMGQMNVMRRTATGKRYEDISVPLQLGFGESLTRSIGSRMATSGTIKSVKRELEYARSATKLGRLRHSSMHLINSTLGKVGEDFYRNPNVNFSAGSRQFKIGKAALGIGAVATSTAAAYAYNLYKNKKKKDPIEALPEGRTKKVIRYINSAGKRALGIPEENELKNMKRRQIRNSNGINSSF